MIRYLMIFVKGMAMGAADIVPGVSGGTIAFITGVYQELLDSLRSMTPSALKVWYQKGFKAFWRTINGNFLLALFGGVLLSMVSLANVVTYCLTHYPLIVWGFFFGMVLASTLYVIRPLPMKQPLLIVLFIIGACLAASIGLLKPAQFPQEWWMVMLAGSIAICAMLLPGTSGSFLLVLMGMYGFILQSLVEFNLVILISFAIGCAAGLLLFSHFLAWLLRSYHDMTLALMTGFLLGSLSIIWPWKHITETTLDRHGKVIPLTQDNVLPMQYEALTGLSSYMSYVLTAAVIGFVLVFLIEYLATRLKR